MKSQRHNAILELVAAQPVTNQDHLRQLLKRRGIEITQATLSRDIHELRLAKGPGGYTLPANGNNQNDEMDDSPPSVEEMVDSFGLRVVRAMNQVIFRTVMGGAQPVAAALDYEEWDDVAGTLAGDDTVLIICADPERATLVEGRLRKMLES
jgi:transcriptional regulator of arginine metabolism